MLHHYWLTFVQLIQTPFQSSQLIWGIVPLYFAWLTNEITSAKASFRTAIQTGFSFIWAAAHWTYQYGIGHINFEALFAINLLVTLAVLVIGLVALVSGFRRRYPRYCSFLGHTRFCNYFMIAIFPIQSRVLDWSWERLATILLFAVPIWMLAHFGLMPLRK